MTQWPSQSEAVVVLPARPLTTQRGRLICIYKICWYSLALFFILGLSIQLSVSGDSLHLIGSTKLYLSGLDGLMFFLFVKAKWTLDEFRVQQQMFGVASPRRQHRASISKMLDALFPYFFLWWVNPLDIAVYPPSRVIVREAGEGVQEQGEQAPAWHTTRPGSCVVEALSPVVRIMISLFDTVTLSLIGANGKKMVMTFNKQHVGHRYAALIAYLANGGWMVREHILNAVYRKMADQASSFDRDRHRIAQLVNDMARCHGLMPVELFENKKEPSKQAMWRLSALCVVEHDVSCLLDVWSRRIEEAQATNAMIPLEALREGYRQVIEGYSKGFLARYLSEPDLWRWAYASFFAYRKQCLDILEYAARQEYRAGQQHPEHQKEYFVRAAKLYEKCAMIAIEAIPDRQRGEQNLRKCLNIYEHDLQNSRAAGEANKRYKKQRNRSVSSSHKDHDNV